VRLPRDVSGEDLARRLARLEYQTTRQTGSHLRLTTNRNGQHHITIPRHAALRIGTLAAILAELELHHHLDREALLDLLFH
jgi:predicted RNA binding protein YcfA (HicA-like mRNA interferase family)